MSPAHPTLDALRDATRDAHEALDRSLAFAHEPSEERLVGYLAAMLGYLEPSEAALWSLPELAHLQPERRSAKAKWIREDLARLAPDLDPPRLVRAVPEWPAALGAAYVLEGSTLGGRVLARMEPFREVRFFEGYGAETGAMWSALVAAIEREGASHRSAIVRAARREFEEVRAWLESRGACVAQPREGVR